MDILELSATVIKALLFELLAMFERVGSKWTYFPVYPG